MSRPLTRRELLAGGFGGAAATFLAACGGTPATKKAASIKPAGSDLGAIEHVVMLMQENRSFDHYFGSYKGVRGFDDHKGSNLGAFSQLWPQAGSTLHASNLLPFHLDTSKSQAECTFDLTHDWGPQHMSWNGGKMDRFVEVHTSVQNEGPENGVLTMGYYTRQDLGFYYALADAFTICDGYHCSVMGPTFPNRLHWLSGTLDPDGRAGGPVLFTDSSPDAEFSVHWSTMPEVLESHGISYKTYNALLGELVPKNGAKTPIINNILWYFSQYRDPSSPLYQKSFLPTYPSDFAKDVAAGTLPQVSWIMPGIGDSEHPPAPPEVGMQFVNGILSTLVSNPDVWSKTVLFITWDENDGFFDHVPPPTPPRGTEGEYLTVKPLPGPASGIDGPVGLGFRVPLLVVSPFSRGGFVCSDTFDHTSHLRFLEERFGVKAPNISSWRRSVTGDLTSTLQLHSPDTSVPSLPATPGKADPVVVIECTTGQLDELEPNNPAPYPLPANQVMPTQEPGSARRVPV